MLVPRAISSSMSSSSASVRGASSTETSGQSNSAPASSAPVSDTLQIEIAPAARHLQAGRFDLADYPFKGPVSAAVVALVVGGVYLIGDLR